MQKTDAMLEKLSPKKVRSEPQTNLYEKPPRIILYLKLLPSLAVKDCGKVAGSFGLAIEEIQYVSDRQAIDSSHVEKVNSHCTHSQNSYIIYFFPCREPTLPLLLQNQREAAVEGLARTTISLEGWHFGIQACFTGNHPTVWQLVNNFQKDRAMQEFDFFQATSGLIVPRSSKMQRT